jgi:AcrR family transcriptional regulator
MRSTPPRSTLDREAVLRAGLDLANAEGIDAVTFRRLGEVLSVTPMALYRHVSNKSDLLEGIFDLVTNDAAVTDHDEVDWRDWVSHSFVRMGDAMLRQRGVMALVNRLENFGKNRSAIVEEIFCRLCDAGLAPAEAAELQQDLYRYMLGTVALDSALRGDATDPDHERHTRARLDLLPSAEFPTVTRHAEELAQALTRTDLERGLRRIIDAFERERESA